MYHVIDGQIIPQHRELETPVRAIVVPILDEEAVLRIFSAIHRYIVPAVANGIILQDFTKLHSTLFHTSTHIEPNPALPKDIVNETEIIHRVARTICPLEVYIERIVVTKSGSLLLCWQTMDVSNDPAELRRKFGLAFPELNSKQILKDSHIFHTTLGRVVFIGAEDKSMLVQTLIQSLADATSELCGLKVRLEKLWYVQEKDALALALNGRFDKYEIDLACEKLPSDQ